VSERGVMDGLATANGSAELIEQLRTKNAQLELALSSRILIEQAKGILSERYRLDMDEAFTLLRGAARSNRLRIHALAEAVINSPRTPTAIELELVRRRLVKR
jgi:AmiR/NasT family two-component response regulator